MGPTPASLCPGRGGTRRCVLLSRYLGVLPGVHSPAPRAPGQACQAGSTQSMDWHVLRVKLKLVDLTSRTG